MATHSTRPAAAIDLGTNTALLLIARSSGAGALDVLEEHCRTPRLGSGLARTGMLDPVAIERALAALSEFARAIAGQGIEPARVRLVSTAVLRRARDAQAFVALVRERTALALEILSEEDEARLGYLAASAECGAADAFVIDVGGGSSELACPGGRPRFSAPIGAVVLSESFADDRAGWAELERAVDRACAVFPAGIARGREAVALGGSALNLAALEAGLVRFDPAAVEGRRVEPTAARRWARELAPLTLDRRRLLPIEPERLAILPAGLCCLAGVLARIEASGLVVSGRGLRYGVLHELLARIDGPEARS